MQTIDLQLESDYVELKHLLKLTGVCDSGGAAKTVISEGQVRVDLSLIHI